MDQCGLVDNIAQWTGTWMKGSSQWMLIDWSPATWRAISCDLEGHVLASVLPNLSINDLDQNMESLLIKFADDIKQRGRQLTGPRSKVISTGQNNSLNLTRRNLIGINGGSCPWVQRSTCTWDGEKWLNCNTWDNLGDFIDSRLGGSPQCDVNVKKTPMHTNYIALRAESGAREVAGL